MKVGAVRVRVGVVEVRVEVKVKTKVETKVGAEVRARDDDVE